MIWKLRLLLLFLLLIAGCGPTTAVSSSLPTTAAVATATAVSSATPTQIPPTATATPFPPPAPPTLTPIPTTTPPPATATSTATPTPTATATPLPSPTRAGSCADRIPGDDLLTLVTLDYGLSREYEPADLVDLNDYLPHHVTQGYLLPLRAVAVPPLVQLIADMEAVGLHPKVLSGYRSYSTQSLAWAKWNETNPETAAIVSAPPGRSEHQLGTTVDFGSPELPDVVGEEDIEFHTYFYMTSEGAWLLANAHRYGFTLSYPREAFELTGFYYEPWHYRYVGVELATALKEEGTFLAAYLLENFPEPCEP